MILSHVRVVAAVALVASGVQGCAGRAAATVPSPQSTTASAGAPAKRWTEADVRFISGMIGHHAQAIVMARLAATHEASESIKILAGRVINAQRDEIHAMQTWLRDRGQQVPEPDTAAYGSAASMAGHEHMGHAMMPGMLTAAQLKELDAARGKEFDRLFLTFMIQHHKGAVEMVKTLVGSTGAAQDDTVFKLASDINVDQTTEIARMQQMLAGLLFGS
jgi:uncharacterized protein (DUF305 family)